MIRLNPLGRARRELFGAWSDDLLFVIESGTWIGGPFVAEFESNWAEAVGVQHCVGVGNGLDALTVALMALNLPHGSTVAVPAHSYVADPIAVHRAGLTPVFVDCDLRGQIDVERLAEISPTPAAVIAVHMHGAHCDMHELLQLCSSRGMRLVEDCAQAHLGKQGGRRLGSFGDISVFSFYPTKNLPALGDAGAICTTSEDLAAACRRISNVGGASHQGEIVKFPALNSRLDPLQARFLTSSLPHLEEWTERRQSTALRYIEALDGKAHLQPLIREVHASVWHHFVVRAEDPVGFRERLTIAGVECGRHYRKSVVEAMGSLSVTEFPNARAIAERGVSIPIHHWLEKEEIDFIVDLLANT